MGDVNLIACFPSHKEQNEIKRWSLKLGSAAHSMKTEAAFLPIQIEPDINSPTLSRYDCLLCLFAELLILTLKQTFCEWGLSRRNWKVSSSNTIKSSDSHKNRIKERWRRKWALGNVNCIEGSRCLLWPFFVQIFRNFCFYGGVGGEEEEAFLQTQHRRPLMWQEILFTRSRRRFMWGEIEGKKRKPSSNRILRNRSSRCTLSLHVRTANYHRTK